jgi:hypothetical protein
MPEQHHRHHHDDVEPAAHMPDRALQQLDEPDRHAVGFHQIADQDEERDRQQHEIVNPARHLLREDDAGQRALHPDKDQRGERQRKTDRQAAEQCDEEADQHQHPGRRHRGGRERIPREVEGRDETYHDHAGNHVAHRPRAKDIEREGGHEQRADPHRIERQFERKPRAGGLSRRQGAELDRVERDIARDDGHQHGTHGIDNGSNFRGQHVGEKSHAKILAAGERTRRAEKARSDHQTARHVVGPFDRRVEQETQQHRAADHEEVGEQKDRGDRVADREQRRHDPMAPGWQWHGARHHSLP